MKGLLVLGAFLLTQTTLAAEYHGRFFFGGYLAKETEKATLENSSNDGAAISSRFYLAITKIGAPNLETIVDVRDKNDFFDKLDQTKLTLKNKNELQVRELYLRRPSDEIGFYGSAGRFAVTEAGSIYTDGLELGRKWTPAFSTSLFGGLNSKRPDQVYVTYNSDSFVYGGYALYHPTRPDWDESFYITNAFVVEEVKSQIDRLFWYEHWTYQPNLKNRFIGLFYLDFVPRIYIQNLYLNYWREISSTLSFDASGAIIDALEYQRRQGIRERLKASPYREASARIFYNLTTTTQLSLESIHGLRTADSEWKHEYSLTTYTSSLFSPQFSAQATLGYRNNFVSDDYFGRLVLAYYSRKWEVSLNEYAAHEKYSSTKKLIPIVSELNLYHFFWKDLFASISFEHAWDSDAQYMSGFFKVGYNFGSRDTPMVRNAAPAGRPL